MTNKTAGKIDAGLQEELIAAVEDTFESEQLAWLETIVNQPSHTESPDDVEAAAETIDERAGELGLSVTRIPAEEERFADHRVYESASAKDEPALALVGHVDTVFPRSSGFLHYRRDGDVAFGPGVLDMKSGLSVILFALRALRQVQPEAYERLRVRFFCVTDEEVGSPTSRHVYDSYADRISEALVFEKGRERDRIVTSRKGGGTFRMGAVGKAAHAGNAHAEGVSAIHALALVVPRLEALTDYERGVTVNVGIIEGGTAKNTVPQHASCTIDVRCVTSEDADRVIDQLRAIAEDPLAEYDGPARERLSKVEFHFSGSITRPPMEATPAIQELRGRYESYASAVGLKVGEAPRQGGFSDSNLLAAHGIPTIDGLGPDGGGAHSLDEWCDLVSLKRRTRALSMFLAETLAGSS